MRIRSFPHRDLGGLRWTEGDLPTGIRLAVGVVARYLARDLFAVHPDSL
jgi:hypothetical protein